MMVTVKLKIRLMLISMQVKISMEELQTLTRLYQSQLESSPIMVKTLLQQVTHQVLLLVNITHHINQILLMVRVAQHSGTMEMVREKTRQMLTGMLLIILMEELQTSIKLSQNQLALSQTTVKTQNQLAIHKASIISQMLRIITRSISTITIVNHKHTSGETLHTGTMVMQMEPISSMLGGTLQTKNQILTKQLPDNHGLVVQTEMIQKPVIIQMDLL